MLGQLAKGRLMEPELDSLAAASTLIFSTLVDHLLPVPFRRDVRRLRSRHHYAAGRARLRRLREAADCLEDQGRGDQASSDRFIFPSPSR